MKKRIARIKITWLGLEPSTDHSVIEESSEFNHSVKFMLEVNMSDKIYFACP